MEKKSEDKAAKDDMEQREKQIEGKAVLMRQNDIILQPGFSSRGVRARQFAHHEKGVARLNNGSFGSCPAAVQAAQAEWKAQWLKQPDSFVYNQLEGGLKASREAIAGMINAASVEEVVLLDNVTTAVSMLAQDIAWGFIEGKFQKGDAVLLLSFAYGSVKTCFESVVGRAGGQVIYAKLPFPVSSKSDVLQWFEAFLERDRVEKSSRAIRLAVIDHITSMPALLLPVKEMVALSRAYGIEQILIDGAHAFGSVDIDVQDIDADYYASNLHKWFFTPSTVAFFHCKSHHIPRLHHPVVSTTHGKGLAAECAWVGTRDYSAQLAIPSSINFMNVIGGMDIVRSFNHSSVLAMGEMLAQAWGTNIGAPPEMVPFMVMVGLPPLLQIQSCEDGLELRTLLREEFHVEVPVHYVLKEDQHVADQVVGIPGITAYARVSHQVYNTVEDYQCLLEAVNALVRRGWTPAHLAGESQSRD